ncbi:hypothetical protein RHMOL_Rhmol03G0061000 [Rhododendron molle]|uniref:Uncharacterized protein n=1 Tax=Rhododendron molle TaxID=49168 RepID=A0ACC0PC56_RHOML|nr:hypothetical protein RHMOL_Rhmol03G0061000 [Rhododendron molle]
MGAGMRVLTIVGIAIFCLTHVACGATGTATYYTPPYVPSSCYVNQNNGVMIAAASDAIWNNRAACGRMYRVHCTGSQHCKDQSVVVKIVDYCPPPGCAGTFDLSKEAFSVIADPDAEKINIEYTQEKKNTQETFLLFCNIEYTHHVATATYYTPPYIRSNKFRKLWKVKQSLIIS